MAALAKNEISTPDAYLKQILPKKLEKIALKIWFSEIDKNELGSNSLPYWSVQLMNPVSKSLLIDFLW